MQRYEIVLSSVLGLIVIGLVYAATFGFDKRIGRSTDKEELEWLREENKRLTDLISSLWSGE